MVAVAVGAMVAVGVRVVVAIGVAVGIAIGVVVVMNILGLTWAEVEAALKVKRSGLVTETGHAIFLGGELARAETKILGLR